MASTPLSSHDHIVPWRVYVFNLFALLILMFSTVAVSYVQLPGFLFLSGTVVNNTVALLIAVIKASLVISIFMGVWWGSKLIKLWAMTGFLWFSLMFIIFADYLTRPFEPTPTWNVTDSGSALPRGFAPGTETKQPSPENLNVHIRQ